MSLDRQEGNSRGGTWAHIATAAVLALAAAVRLRWVGSMFDGTDLLHWDGDSAFHWKRISQTIAGFPAVPHFDPEIDWPGGARCPWPDGFDLLAAAWGKLLGFGDAHRTLFAVALFTPMLALVATWASMALARLVVPESPAKPSAVLAAGILTAVARPLVDVSMPGYLDHHVVEPVACLLLAVWALRRFPGPGDFRGSPWRWEVTGGLLATFTIWTFAGGVLYVGIATAIVLAAVLGEDRPRVVGSGAPALAGAAGLSAVLAVPALQADRLLSFQFPSLLPPLLLAAGAAGLALAALAARAVPRPALRWPTLAGALAALATATALAIPDAARSVRGAVEDWLLNGDPWIANILEFQHVGGANRPPFWADLHDLFGAAGVVAPAILWLAFRTSWRTTRARGAAFAALSSILFLLALHQIRFSRVAVPFLMVNTALVLGALATRLRRWELGPRLLPAACALAAVAIDPSFRAAMTWARPRLPYDELAFALRGRQASEAAPGVFSPWFHGNIVNVVSGRPAITTGFGPYIDPATFEDAESALRGTPAELESFLERRRARFVIAGGSDWTRDPRMPSRTPFVRGRNMRGAVLDLAYMRSLPLAPLLIAGSGIPDSGVRHLEHFRPLYSTRSVVGGIAFPVPGFWVYERVAGARLTGTSAPNARVVAALDFTEQGRPHVWRGFTDAGTDGRFELVVPVPTGSRPPSVVRSPALTTASRYRVEARGGGTVEVEVPEDAVRSGTAIAIGDLSGVRTTGSAMRPPP